MHYMHANAEATELSTASLDLVVGSFVMHECPPPAIGNFMKEGMRLLRPGGVFCLVDNNPRCGLIA